MQKIKDLNQEIRKLSAFKLFQDRQTDIFAYRGSICNQKGKRCIIQSKRDCLWQNWIKAKLQKIKVLTQETRVYILASQKNPPPL